MRPTIQEQRPKVSSHFSIQAFEQRAALQVKNDATPRSDHPRDSGRPAGVWVAFS
jgi:hypothetical protein